MKFDFLKACLFITVFFLPLSSNAVEKFTENLQYKRVGAAQPGEASKKDKIEVVEFFLYSCGPCFELDPKLKKWVEKNKDKVTFKRVPAVVSASWVSLAKAYYVAEKLGVLDKTHDALFNSIHIDKEIYLNEFTLSKFYEKYGVKIDDFMREFNSKDIVDKVSDARIMSVKYGFRGVPAVVINNEFKTAPFYNSSQKQQLEEMDYLLAKITAQ